jgi:hypothetical protein
MLTASKSNGFFFVLKGWIWVRIQTSSYYCIFIYIFFSVSVEGPEAASGVDGQLSYFPGTEKKNDACLSFLLKKEKIPFPRVFSSIPRLDERLGTN